MNRKDRRKWSRFAITLASALVLVVLTYPIWVPARITDRKRSPLLATKEAATALSIYVTDFDDHLPHRLANNQELDASIVNYIGGPGFTRLADGVTVEPNQFIAGQKLSKLHPDTVLVYAVVSAGKIVVATVGGDTKTVTSHEFSTMRLRP